jgi:7-carboxy-7-deazaguanine synthase
MADAYLNEVFSSIQGEGPHVGRSALFIRFAGCNLSCGYCDTVYARERTPSFKIFRDSKASGEPAGGESEFPNPVACKDVLGMIAEEMGLPDTVVMTGGEPLLQADALLELAGGLRMRGCSVHLETNGTLPEGLEGAKPAVDFVSMDIKIPSMLGGSDLNDKHAAFLRAMEGLEGCVKIVVSESVGDEELDAAARLVESVNPGIPVYLQPVLVGSKPGIGAAQLGRFQKRLARKLHIVRVSVQIHRILGVR